jgi:hypothetical protein
MNALILSEGLKKVFETAVEYTEETFVELTPQQYAAWSRQGYSEGERVFRVVALEPQMLPGRKLELSVVTDEEKAGLIAATQLIHRFCAMSPLSPKGFDTFLDRLKFVTAQLPREALPPEWRSHETQ